MNLPTDLIKNILSDMKVELTEIFDRNFEEKGFFGDLWKPRKKEGKGTLLVVTSKMRRSIRAAIAGRKLIYTSAVPYTALHNEGGKFAQNVRAHERRNRRTGNKHAVRAHARLVNMVKRQFIGDHPRVRLAIGEIVNDNMTDFLNNLANKLRQ
jgi:phage gpG-like protein